jgi:hypothetical protein
MPLTQTYDPAFPVDKLVEHPDNPRRGNVSAIEASMQAHGFYGAVLAQASTRQIIAGNHRTRAARKQGQPTVPVLFIDVDDDEAKRMLLVDNRTNDLAGYDDAALLAMLQDLNDGGVAGLLGTGFTDEDLEQLLIEIGDPDPDMPKPGDERYTPAWVFEGLGLEFDMDVAAPVVEAERRTPARRFLTVHDDGLATDWEGVVWMNPPYSGAAAWARKWTAHPDGVCLICLSNSSWVPELCEAADAFVFVPGIDFSTPLDQIGAIGMMTFMAARGPVAAKALRRLATIRNWPLCKSSARPRPADRMLMPSSR